MNQPYARVFKHSLKCNLLPPCEISLRVIQAERTRNPTLTSYREDKIEKPFILIHAIYVSKKVVHLRPRVEVQNTTGLALSAMAVRTSVRRTHGQKEVINQYPFILDIFLKIWQSFAWNLSFKHNIA